MKNACILLLISFSLLTSETLFEVKDSANNKVLDVSTDGLRILNQGDTVMVISSNQIKANLESSKGLSRSFSVSTSSSKGPGSDLMRLTSDSTRFWISDTGSGFGVAKSGTAKGLTKILEVTTSDTKMREGSIGDRYTGFSPSNMFLGLKAGNSTTTGANNIFIGNNAGVSNTASNNLFIGHQAGFANTTGSYNAFMGYQAGYSNQDGGDNIYIGYKAGYSITGGFWNNFIGKNSGANKTTGNWNNFFGMESGNNNNGYYNTFIGHISGQNNNGNNNTLVGAQSGNSCGGNDNVMIGYSAGRDAAGGNNCFIGTNSGSYSVSGTGNTLVGNGSARGMSNGTYSNNTFLGYETGRNITTGSGNVFLGYQAGYNENGSNKLYVDNSDTNTPLIFGDFYNNMLTVNGELTASGNINANSSVNVVGNINASGTNIWVANNPGTGSVPLYYLYQGGSYNSTSKQYAFSIYDALWVTSNTFIDGNTQFKGGTPIGKVQAGEHTAGSNTTGGVLTSTITFPSSFTSTPKITVSPVCEYAVNDMFVATVKSISTTS